MKRVYIKKIDLIISFIISWFWNKVNYVLAKNQVMYQIICDFIIMKLYNFVWYYTLIYTLKFGLIIWKINIKVKKIDKLFLKIYKIFIIDF